MLTSSQVDYAETPTESLPGFLKPKKEETKNDGEEEDDPYYQSDKRKWLDTRTEATGRFKLLFVATEASNSIHNYTTFCSPKS